ncbi:MAG TPA: CRTAC1 family protein [Pirellulales bacterium]|nr:CRTAC1 family protein [Pirellulales bacterium]
MTKKATDPWFRPPDASVDRRWFLKSIVAATFLAGCDRATPRPDANSPPGPALFRDAAEDTGLIFRHENGMSGAMYMPEVIGSGVALFDYNNDGKLDVFVVQGGVLKPGAKPEPKKGPTHKLFRNDMEILPDGSRVLKFTDVTEEAGLNFADYGMGVVAGDYDGDGFIDLYVTCLGRNRLLHNNGDGTFTDVTETAGVGGDGWNTSAAWVDFDRDGRLDLFVCRYLQWTFDRHRMCQNPASGNDYCGPRSFEPARSRLYRNLGNGRFEEISISSRIASKAGAALGVVCADFNGDGWPDLLVANDGMENHLWINQKDGTFKEEALARGCALDCGGDAEANMGVIAADFHNSGRDDLFITHLITEHATFYRNLGGGQFEDQTTRLGLDAATRAFTGFGACAIDYDNDGRLDIFAANGAVKVLDAQVKAGFQPPLRQRCQLFHNDGGPKLRFAEVTEGAFLKVEDVGRGVACGDFRNNGAVDLVVANNNGPLRLLLNQVRQKNHWLGLRLVDGPVGRRFDVLGAVATLERSGQPSLRRRCATDGSYLSSSDPRVVFGLDNSAAFDCVRVLWPDGSTEAWRGLAADQYHELAKGTGRKEQA